MVAVAQFVVFVSCSLFSGWFLVRQYRAAGPLQRRQMLAASIPAAALALGLAVFAAMR
jgi:hypothetical protein